MNIKGNGNVIINGAVPKSPEYLTQPGTTVSLDVEPNPGYKLSSLTYTTDSGSVDVTQTKSFIMPAADVMVDAVFVRGTDDQSADHPELFRLEKGTALPKTGFSAASQQRMPEKPLDLNYKPVSYALQIPSAYVDAEIVLVPFLDGEYPVTWLDDKAGLLEGSALPGKGQSVLTGHNHLNTTEFGSFASLNGLKKGDRIFVSRKGYSDKIQIFEVYANMKISENDIDALNRLIAMDPFSLTLITCEDERIEGSYANRRVIAARPL